MSRPQISQSVYELMDHPVDGSLRPRDYQLTFFNVPQLHVRAENVVLRLEKLIMLAKVMMISGFYRQESTIYECLSVFGSYLEPSWAKIHLFLSRKSLGSVKNTDFLLKSVHFILLKILFEHHKSHVSGYLTKPRR